LKTFIAKTIHWIGFFAFFFMLIVSALDESKDEIIIHFTASSMPLVIAIIIRYIIIKEIKIMPFIK